MGAKPLVSSLSIAFKRATTITEDTAEAKKEHRQTLKSLMDKYQEDVVAGKAEGIRTAKELVEVIKLDLLLMGEATERTGVENPVDELQLSKITQALDVDNPEVQALIDSVFNALNGANDDLDPQASLKVTVTEQVQPEEPTAEPIEEGGDINATETED